tara:strand:+ start:847 stop:1779 length:933 start_codon:yes stop_codon:yes gene_type:complete
MKHLEDTPWWICDPKDTNYVAYSDTDSIYIHAEPLLRFKYSNFDEMGEKEKDNKLEKIAESYEKIITKSYKSLAVECFNVKGEHRLDMKTECVIRAAYFRATRRYAQWITKQEGIENETLDVKGLEFKKANFPPVFGKFFKSCLEQVLKGVPKHEIDSQLLEFRRQILSGEIPLEKIGNPQAVKKMNKFTERKARVGEIFSTIGKGAPAAVKASIIYNDLLKFWKLDKKYNYITQGEKIKWIYLKNNPYRIDAIAFLDYDIPDKIRTFIEQYADKQKVFESILLNKLEGFYNDLGWSLSLNPHRNKFFKF